MKDLIIVGASGFGREVAWLVERINQRRLTWNLLGFIDDDREKQGKEINGYPVLGTVEEAGKYADANFVCAIGASKIRKSVVEAIRAVQPSAAFATLIDPSAEISDFVNIGEGSIICAQNIITVNVEIGNHVIINLDCTIGHDAILQDFVTVYPNVNISGAAKIGTGVELGTGTQIIQGKEIGEGSIIGAGAVVVKDIPANCTAVGIPAKAIKYFEA